MPLFQQCFFFAYFASANQQPSFSICGTSAVNTQSVHNTSKSIIAEIHPNDTILLGKRPSMAILASET